MCNRTKIKKARYRFRFFTTCVMKTIERRRQMNDEKIIELFFARDEQALAETEKKYKSLWRYIVANFLAIPEDREECLNDVLIELWNSIPPDRPNDLRAYSVTILRRRAIDRTRSANAWKRSGNIQTVGEEFLTTLDDGTDLAADYENSRAIKIVNGFLDTLPKLERSVFVMRYCLGDSIGAIAQRTGSTEGRIKMMLLRTRKKLKEKLIKEGIAL